MMNSNKNVKVIAPKHNQPYIQPTVYFSNGNQNIIQTRVKMEPTDTGFIQGIKVLNCPVGGSSGIERTPQIITQSQFLEIQKAYQNNMNNQSSQKIVQSIAINPATFNNVNTGDVKPEIVSIPIDSQILVLKTRKRQSESATPTEVLTKAPRIRTVKGKGLRHFSMKVCQKVQQKGITSYNEVADELVQEFLEMRDNDKNSDPVINQSIVLIYPTYATNIRRRVYDALNVLMAMNIISKQKKEIRWVGLPTNTASELTTLTTERDGIKKRIEEKRHHIKELILQQIAFKNLVSRNEGNEMRLGSPSFNLLIRLPFVVVNTNVNTVIDCSISQDKYEYMFNFNKSFEINDDIDIMKRMGLVNGLDTGNVSFADLQSSLELVPDNLKKYVLELANNQIKKERTSSPLESQISDYDDSDASTPRPSTSKLSSSRFEYTSATGEDSNSCMSSSIDYE